MARALSCFLCLALSLISWHPIYAQAVADWLSWYEQKQLDSLFQVRKQTYESASQANDTLALGQWAKTVAVDRVRLAQDYTGAVEINHWALLFAAQDTPLLSACLNNEGIYRTNLGQWAAGKEAYLRCLQIDRKLNDSLSLAKSLHNMANFHMLREDYTASRRFLFEAIHINQLIENGPSLTKNLYAVSVGYSRQNQWDSARTYLTQAYQAGKTYAQPLTSIVISTGRAYQETNRPDSAYYYFTQGLQLARKAQDLAAELDALHAINGWHLDQAEYDQALRYGRRALQTMGNTPVLIRPFILSGIAMAFKQLQAIDSARYYYYQAITFTDAYQQVGDGATFRLSLANLERKTQHWQAATQLLTWIQDHPQLQDDRYKQTKTQIEYGLLLADQGKNSQATRTLSKAIDPSLAQQDWEGLVTIYDRLGKIAAQQGNATQAFDYLQAYQRWKDSLVTRNFTKTLAEVRTAYETDLKEAELIRTNQEKELLSQSLQRSTFLQRLSWGASIFLGMLAIVLTSLFLRIRRQQRQINEQRQHLHQLNQTKDRLFALIAHDLSGPFSNFEGLHRLYQHHLSKGNFGKVQQLGGHISDQTRQLKLLLDNLLQWALQQMEAYQADFQSIDIVPLLQALGQSYQAQADQKSLTIHYDMPATFHWQGDTKGLRIALNNLLSNALKFTQQGSITLQLTSPAHPFVLSLLVRDTGVGMSADRLNTLQAGGIISPFKGYQGERGAGIGLHFVREWVHKQNGEMIIQSEVGTGSNIGFQLPATPKK